MISKFILFSTISFLVLISSCKTDKNEEQSIENDSAIENAENQLPERKVVLSYFETEFGWGYNVEINGKNYIQQIHLPCECGGEGFKTKEKATITAEFLKHKIENHERNLRISRAQLDSLGAL
jgi:hypothetical protein